VRVAACSEELYDYNSVHEPLCSTSIASGRKCDPEGTLNLTCRVSPDSMNFGVYSFDNIALSWLNVLVAISQEGWTEIMYAVSATPFVLNRNATCGMQIGDAVSKWNYIFFIALIITGSYFVIHLITAVLFIRFEQTKDAEQKKYGRSACPGDTLIHAAVCA
jgi:hypothetical protein